MFKKFLNFIRGIRVKPLSKIDNLEDLKRYEKWISDRGCPAGPKGKPGIK